MRQVFGPGNPDARSVNARGVSRRLWRLVRASALSLCLLATASPASMAQVLAQTGLDATPIPTAPVQREGALQERDRMIEMLRLRIEALEARLNASIPAPQTSQPAIPSSGGAGIADAEIDPEAAERALERSLVRTGALLLPRGVIEIDPGLSYAREEEQGAALSVAPGGGAVLGSDRFGRDAFTFDVAARFGLPGQTQVEIAVPVRTVNEERVTLVGGVASETESRGSGLGDVRIGVAKAFAREEGWRPDLIARLSWDTDTGEDADHGVGLGGGFHEISAGVVALKRQDPLVFVAGASYTATLEKDDVKPGDRGEISLSTLLAVSPETSLRFGVSAAYEDDLEVDGRTIAGTDRRLASLLLGASGIVGRSAFVDVGLSVGLTEDAPDYALSLSVPFRWALRQ